MISVLIVDPGPLFHDDHGFQGFGVSGFRVLWYRAEGLGHSP